MYLVNVQVFEYPVRIAKKEVISSLQLGMHNRIPLNSQLILLNPTLKTSLFIGVISVDFPSKTFELTFMIQNSFSVSTEKII